MEMVTVSLISLAVLCILLTFGVPLPYCFGGGLMVMAILGDATMKGTMLWGFNQLSNPVLLCIPLFVFAGSLLSESGIAASLLSLGAIDFGMVGDSSVVMVENCVRHIAHGGLAQRRVIPDSRLG